MKKVSAFTSEQPSARSHGTELQDESTEKEIREKSLKKFRPLTF